MMSAALAGHDCRICGSPALHEFDRFRELKRVTSDSRPWAAGGRLAVCHACGAVQKLIAADWLDEINRIYQSYAIYHQAGGKEQPIFAGNGAPPQPRSVSLLRYLSDKLNVPPRASVLDFGCGTGSALRTFSSCHPEWSLHGAELSTRSLALLENIPGFVRLYTCPPAGIPKHFDLITLIHALEHVLDPVATMRDLAGRLTRGGALFVQVPDCAKTPYDLVIADHLLHFTLDTLRHASERAGCSVLELTDSVLPKELSLMARAGEARKPEPSTADPRLAVARARAQVEWLFAQVTSVTNLAKDNRRFGLFGTSISATWLAGILGDQVSFFVDEDEDRIGGQHMGRPILAVDDISSDSDVFVALVPKVAASVIQRLSRPDIRFHAPPPFEALRSNYEMAKLC